MFWREYSCARLLLSEEDGHTLRTEAGLSRFIEEAPSPCVLPAERISTLRRSAYREEEAGVSRWSEISMHSQHIEIVNQVKYEHPKCHLYLFVKWENTARLTLDMATRFHVEVGLR